MQHYGALKNAPIFLPSVAHFHQGMLVNIPLHRSFFAKSITPAAITELLAEYYADEPCIRVMPLNDENSLSAGFLDPESANHTNRVDLFVFGHDEQMVIIARLDNLGKGASGAAVQNLNIMLGLDELQSLSLGD